MVRYLASLASNQSLSQGSSGSSPPPTSSSYSSVTHPRYGSLPLLHPSDNNIRCSLSKRARCIGTCTAANHPIRKTHSATIHLHSPPLPAPKDHLPFLPRAHQSGVFPGSNC